MTSDFGKNKNRIDIKLNDSTGVKTIKEVIELIKLGKTVIRTKMKPSNDRIYNCNLVKEIKKLKISDIRYGTMSHHIGNGVGYTLYK